MGPQSDQAGKVDSCAGCPNQQACASGDAKSASDNAAAQFVKDRMASVKHKILILSGKPYGASCVAGVMSFSLFLSIRLS
ncbi:hypothetical protein EON64_04750 [archaeon]|nr:MAG: hypothetical protein EON64_04750 [archaeon]